jgi:hypothetical protein
LTCLKYATWDGDMAQAAEGLLSKCKVLFSNPNTDKIKATVTIK